MFEVVKSVRRSLLEHPEEWRFCEFRATPSESGMSLWVSNGPTFLQNRGAGYRFGLIEKFMLWPAVRRAQGVAMMRAVGPKEDDQ